jgi:predicted  nucleic acid-binding Zn-ribbon protein
MVIIQVEKIVFILTGIPTDDEDDDDIHFCKKCKKVFKKLEEYLEHKVKHDKFKVLYSRAPGDRRMVLPTLMKKEPAEEKEASPVVPATDGELKEGDVAPVRRRRGEYVRLQHWRLSYSAG